MAGTLPNVRGAATCLYPVTRIVSFDTAISIAANGTEQRMKRRNIRHNLVLPYSRVKTSDMEAMRNFFNSQQGAYDTFSVYVGTSLYANCVFEQDEFAVTEDDQWRTHWSFTLRLRQTQRTEYRYATAGTIFALFANGCLTQFPYTRIERFLTTRVDQPSGPRYAWKWYGGGLSGFPSNLRAWRLSMPRCPAGDAFTIETIFRSKWGRYEGFSFVDPDDGNTYTNCRFDTDNLEIVYLSPYECSLTLPILQTNG